MKRDHIELCSSEAWGELLRTYIVPDVLWDAELGDEVLELGSGPGLSTDVLHAWIPRLIAVELDEALASRLHVRFDASARVQVVRGDACSLPLVDNCFSGAVAFTMMHHVPTDRLQDVLFAEVSRILRPGGMFAAFDGSPSDELRAMHEDEHYNAVDPATLPRRLSEAGFESVEVRSNEFGWVVHAQT